MTFKRPRHSLARTTVDVYRLFKIKSLASAVGHSRNPVLANLGLQILAEARTMAEPYAEEQRRISDAQAAKSEKTPKLGKRQT